MCTWAGGVLHPFPGCGNPDGSPSRSPLARVSGPAGLGLGDVGGQRPGRGGWQGAVGEGGGEGAVGGEGRRRGASGLGEGGRGADGAPGGRAWLLGPAVHAAAPRVHEEIADGVELQAELLRDGDLHLLRRPLVLLKDGDQRAPLQVGEHQALLLGLQRALLLLLLLLSLAGCGRAGGRAGRSATVRPHGRRQATRPGAERHEETQKYAGNARDGGRDDPGTGPKETGRHRKRPGGSE